MNSAISLRVIPFFARDFAFFSPVDDKFIYFGGNLYEVPWFSMKTKPADDKVGKFSRNFWVL